MSKKKDPQTHDLSERVWGHNYEIMTIDGNKMKIAGWTRGIVKGDFIIMRGDKGVGTTRYKVQDISYCRDPKDMFFANIEFAPRIKGNG